MMWYEYAIVSGIAIFFVALMYQALKEPIHLLFSGIAYVFGMLFDSFSDGGAVEEVISYG